MKMKRLFLLAMVIASAAFANAQNFAIKNAPSTAEDYMLLLEANGSSLTPLTSHR